MLALQVAVEVINKDFCVLKTYCSKNFVAYRRMGVVPSSNGMGRCMRWTDKHRARLVAELPRCHELAILMLDELLLWRFEKAKSITQHFPSAPTVMTVAFSPGTNPIAIIPNDMLPMPTMPVLGS